MTAAEKQSTPQELFEARLLLAESAFTHYFVTIPALTPYSEILKPEYWVHVTKKLGKFTRLTVTTDDMEYYADLLVLDVGPTWAVVKELQKFDLNNVAVLKAAKKNQDFSLSYRGPHYKWSVIRNKDKAVIKEGFVRQEQAASFLNEYIKTITR